MKAIPRSRYLLFFSLAAGGLAIDLVSKRWIFDRLEMPNHRPTEWLWKPVFGFTTNLNEGALFGMGQGQVLLFAVLSIVAAAGILYWLFISGAASDRLITVALALVMGGILGNLYDRLGMPGLVWDEYQPDHVTGAPVYAVRDWLNFALIDWPIFNIADSLLVCGAGLLMVHAYWFDFKAEAKKPAAKA